jgi:uncharacterized protein YkwD
MPGKTSREVTGEGDMRRVGILAAVAALLVAGVASATDGRLPGRLNQPISAERVDQDLFDEAVLIFSNAARRQHGKAPLRSDPGLSRAAADHALNMARLRKHSHELPVRGQANLTQRMHRQSLEYRLAAENIAMDKLYRLLGRPISTKHQGCSFAYADTREAVPIHTYASLAEQVVARWLSSPKHRASLLSGKFARLGAGVGIDRQGSACGDVYTVQTFAD